MRWNLRSLLPKGSIIIFFFCCACDPRAQAPAGRDSATRAAGREQMGHHPGTGLSGNPYPTVESIPVPAGYRRVAAGKSSFGGWLRQIPLRKDRTVYLFDGSPKRNGEPGSISGNGPAGSGCVCRGTGWWRIRCQLRPGDRRVQARALLADQSGQPLHFATTVPVLPPTWKRYSPTAGRYHWRNNWFLWALSTICRSGMC
ncbi:MAG TPA: hypothetical protein VNS58_16800 [Puia sp.]|nr:hypothetical protein [Puia sp.]